MTCAAAISGSARSTVRCRHCPPGSESARDAMALGHLGQTGKTLMLQLGARDTEPWCPHCAAFAIDLIQRYQIAADKASKNGKR